MKLVYVCSALRDKDPNIVKRNQERAKDLCRKIALTREEVPIAPHIYLPQFLVDGLDDEREVGLNIGLDLLSRCDKIIVFIVNGYVSDGMKAEMEYAKAHNIPIETKFSFTQNKEN